MEARSVSAPDVAGEATAHGRPWSSFQGRSKAVLSKARGKPSTSRGHAGRRQDPDLCFAERCRQRTGPIAVAKCLRWSAITCKGLRSALSVAWLSFCVLAHPQEINLPCALHACMSASIGKVTTCAACACFARTFVQALLHVSFCMYACACVCSAFKAKRQEGEAMCPRRLAAFSLPLSVTPFIPAPMPRTPHAQVF